MKVAFVSANRERMPDACIPLGLLYVMAACPAKHEKQFWDLNFEEQPMAALGEKLTAFDPDVVALGLRNLQSNDYSGSADNLAYYEGLVATVRRHSHATLVVGGAAFSIMPGRLMQVLRPDFGISGEGEVAFATLLEALETTDASRRQHALSAIHGLYWLDADSIPQKTSRRAAYTDLTRNVHVERTLVDPRYYARWGIDSVQTKRGCELHCTYCTYRSIEGSTSRTRPAASVADEFDAMSAAGRANHVFVVDSVFNLPTEHAISVCDELIAHRNALPWTCYVNPTGFTPTLAQRMREAGCVGVEIGSDSGSDPVLAMLGKGFDTACVVRASKSARDAGLKDCHTFILGTPGETDAQMHDTLDFIIRLQPYCAIIMVWNDDDALTRPELAEVRRSMREKAVELLRKRKSEFARWIIPPLGMNFGGQLFSTLRTQGFRGPLWQHIDVRRRTDALPRRGPQTSGKEKPMNSAMRAACAAETGDSPQKLDPQDALLRKLGGGWITHVMSAAARLGLADALAEAPLTTDALAARLACNPRALARLLHALVGQELLVHHDDGTYGLTATGGMLRSDELGPLAVFLGSPMQALPWMSLEHTLQTGQAAFTQVHGEELYSYLQKHPKEAQVFEQAMDALSRLQVQAVARAYDFSTARHLVDIGGGAGTLLLELLPRFATLRGMLFDLPEVIERARERFQAADLVERCEFLGGNFMQEVPAGADTYVLKHVLHNWGDEECVSILRHCERAMAPGGRLLLIEHILLPQVMDMTRLLDLEMMVLTEHGRERSKPEFRKLTGAAGLKIVSTCPLPGVTSWLLIVERPT